jgi:uncharacterized protein (DUF885 family)
VSAVWMLGLALAADPRAVRHEAASGMQHPALRAVAAAHWEDAMLWSPEWATSLGYRMYDLKVTDRAVEATVAHDAVLRRFQARLSQVAALPLGSSDQVHLRLLQAEVDAAIARRVCAFERWRVGPRENPLTDFHNTVEVSPLDAPADGARLIRRLDAWTASLVDHSAALDLGLKEGLTANSGSVANTIALADGWLALPGDAFPLGSPLTRLPETWSVNDREAFSRDWRAAMGRARAGVAAWRDHLNRAVLPAGRGDDAPGLSHLPGGDDCYRALIHEYTTTATDAGSLHHTGLRELERIHGEMAVIGERVFGTADLPTLFARLREDPALRFGSREELLATAESALRRAERALPAVIGRLPSTPCVVAEIPATEAPYTTIAYYRQPGPGGSKPGEYFVNTYQPETRPRFEAEALAFHESVPGHHTQIALSYEAAALPAFRRYGGQTVFVEGWALYSEKLADELGLYSGDLDQLGRLSFEAWRASRLVVDTGLHAYGWSRGRAESFLAENAPIALNNVVNEVDRYIATPGQALAYMTGRLEILRIREEAKSELGDRFDLREFHDAVLGQGAVTLSVLEAQVDAWVARARAGAAP